MSKLVEEVDERDRLTGRQLSRAEAHDQRVPHRVAAVYVFDKQGRLFVQVHKKSDGLLDHSVGGHVDVGETYAQAAKREGEEELGLHDVPLTEVALGLYNDEGSYKHTFGLYECSPENWSFRPNDEVEEVFPMSIADIVEQMNQDPMRFTAGFIRTLRSYIDIKHLSYILTAHKPKIINDQPQTTSPG